ncbi:TetR family transcriptional regulator [Nocardia tengchongensis]
MPRPSLPKQDRAIATRQRLLLATIDSLAELGWAATTFDVVAQRAGVSRGAAQHHFPARIDLVTAAVDEICAHRMLELLDDIHTRPPGIADSPIRTAIVRLIEAFASPLFKAALQVWTAAVADADLHARATSLEKRIGQAAHAAAVSALRVNPADPTAHLLVQTTLDLARGLALADLLKDDSARRLHIAHEWARIVDSALRDSIVRDYAAALTEY